jgi:serine/threonine-protein kinase
LPFDALVHRDLLLQIVTTRPPPIDSILADVPADVAAIVARCLESDPAHRFPTARALSEACRAAIANNRFPRIELSVLVEGPIELPQEVLSSTASLEMPSLPPRSRPSCVPPSPRRAPSSVRVGQPPAGADEAHFGSSLTMLAAPVADRTMTTDAQLALSGPSARRIVEATPVPTATPIEVAPWEKPRRRAPWIFALAAAALAVAVVAFGVTGAPSFARTPEAAATTTKVHGTATHAARPGAPSPGGARATKAAPKASASASTSARAKPATSASSPRK